MTAQRSPDPWPRVSCWVPPVGAILSPGWKICLHRAIFRLTDWLSLDVTTRFYTVQVQSDVCRLWGKGEPWPEGEFQAHLGPGVYSWKVRQDAEDYRAVKQRRVPAELQIVEFRVWNCCLQQFRQLNIDDLNDPSAWLTRYSLLWTEAVEPHGYHYVRRGVSSPAREPPAVEHYFHRSVFLHLWFC